MKGIPTIFNTDQGSQFTSAAFTGLLSGNAIRISMDGRGSWRDNVFVERLWRSVKYEEVYLRAYDSHGVPGRWPSARERRAGTYHAWQSAPALAAWISGLWR